MANSDRLNDAPGIDSNEAARLDALYRLDILDTQPEPGFDRITRLAKMVMGTPIVLISLIDHHRQWFKSCVGLNVTETARDVSFCTHAILADVPLIVQDALEDPRFSDNPLVTGDPNIRFYLGVPLRTLEGFNIGTLCIIDYVPRTPQPEQIAVMQDLAGLVVSELELRQIADMDSLTGTMTRRAFTREAKRAVAQAHRYGSECSCIVIDIDHFKAVNDRYGHAAGDVALRSVAASCRSTLRTTDVLGRVGGEEFAIVLPETSVEEAAATGERLLRAISSAVITTYAGPIKLTASFGISGCVGRNLGLDVILAEADMALYEAKRNGRNRVMIAHEVAPTDTSWPDTTAFDKVSHERIVN